MSIRKLLIILFGMSTFLKAIIFQVEKTTKNMSRPEYEITMV